MIPDDLAQELREKLLLLLTEYLPEETPIGRVYDLVNKFMTELSRKDVIADTHK